jgi:hypothetical protein
MRPIFLRDVRFRDNPIPQSFIKLESWLREREWGLDWSRLEDDHVNFSERMIVLNVNRTPESQLFGLLHEIGHIILSEEPDYTLRFSRSEEFKHRNERSRETLRVKTEVFGEEWEAWVIGEQFSRRLGLEVNYGSYHDARNRDLKSYASWVTEKK